MQTMLGQVWLWKTLLMEPEVSKLYLVVDVTEGEEVVTILDLESGKVALYYPVRSLRRNCRWTRYL